MNAVEQRLMNGRVLVEVGWLAEAELEVAAALAEEPANLDALGLLAKIKHITGELSLAFACWTTVGARARAALARVWADRWCSERERAAILEIATTVERTGQLAPARAELEQLGRRGCARDPGRLLTLIEIYARLATADAAEAGARACRHLLRELAGAGVDKLSLLGALALFERRRGRDHVAAALEARFASAFQRRMHRPTTLDVVRVAARRYLPLARLREIESERELPTQLASRERGLALALADQPRQARSLLEAGRGLLDRIYAAELAGDDRCAIDAVIDALRGGASDPQLVGWLLDRHAARPARAIAKHFGDHRHHVHAHALLARACELAPHRPETWRRLAMLHELAGRDWTRYAIRAAAITAALAPPIGRVLAAGVTQLGGAPKGLLHEILVQRRPAAPGRGGTLAADDILGNLTPELRMEIGNAFVAVREYARSKLPHLTTDIDDYTYLYKVPKDDVPSGGASAGLPSALAMLSVFLQKPISTAIASSGAVVCDAHDTIAIARIGDADYKVKAACHANARTLILPIGNRQDLESSRLVPRSISDATVKYVRDLDAAARLVFGDDLFTRP